MKQSNNEIMKVLKYFSIFGYQPTLIEIHTFLQAKINKNSLEIELNKMIGDRKIIVSIDTPPQYSINQIQKSKFKSQNLNSKVKSKNNETMEQWNNLIERKQISQSKLNSPRFKIYIKLLSLFPQIKLVGLSGSISMLNAKEGDDIDLFIITAKNRLFTARMIALVLAQLFGLRRSRDSATQIFHKTYKTEKFAFASSQKQTTNYQLPTITYKNKVCLNLFFDERELKIPKFKQTVFVGHEVLQMKPIINKGYTYQKFLKENLWVKRIFPNSWQIFNFQFSIFNKLGVIPAPDWNRGQAPAGIQSKYTSLTFNFIEKVLKELQLSSINKHRTTETITATQLWFHPDDFERKIQKSYK